MPTRVQLAEFLQPAHIVVPLAAETLNEALHELAGALRASGSIADEAELDQLLLRSRPRDMVAIGRGVVLPHFRTDAVDRLIVSLGVSGRPLDASANRVEASPRIVALILAPPSAATLYLQTVAALARFFSDDDVIRRLTAATSADQIAAMAGLRDLRIEPQLTVRDVMSLDYTTVSPDVSIRAVVDVMMQKRTRAVTVVDERRQVLGILTEWDVMRALLPHIPRAGEAVEDTDDMTARDVMTRSVLCVSQDMGLTEAVNVMINKTAEQCPVVENGQLVGMLLRSEIIRKLFGR